MINAWHLIWIIPLSGSIGFMWAAVFTISSRSDEKKRRDK